jgi:RNA polymerase sigma-70 factor, ECF subfamily
MKAHNLPSDQTSDRAPERGGARPDFTGLYDEWFDQVSRWLRALGAPPDEHEDLAQEVFMVVRRRLADFDHQNTAGWLFRIASRQVASARRRRWFKSVLGRRPDVLLDELPDAAADPADALEQKQRRRVLEELLASMSDKRRATFFLFEVEGYSGEEIARLQRIPVATVWTRLHHARKEFFALVEQRRRREGRS